MSGRATARLRAALKTEGEPTTHDAVFEKLKEIQWSGEESTAARSN